MFYELKIKLGSHLLGDRWEEDKVFRFKRNSEDSNEILIPLDHWKWAVSEAVEGLQLHQVDKECMYSLVHFYAPTTVLYRRNYQKGPARKVALHEAIPTNYEITFDMLVTSQPPLRVEAPQKGRFSPSKDELGQVIKFIGAFLGISPFGSHKGYGRFTLLDINEKVPTL